MEQSSESVAPIAATQKSGSGLKVFAAIASVVALAGIGFGVYGMMQSTKAPQASDIKVQVKAQDGTLTTVDAPTVEKTNNNGTVVTIVDTPKMTADEMRHYIYISQWGIKIKMPETLTITGYKYVMDAGMETVYISGIDCSENGRCQYAPEFSNMKIENHSLGAVSRQNSEGYELTDNAKLVTTIGDYVYSYGHPHSVSSTDESEKEWEVKSVEAIEAALTNPDNYSEI